MLALIDAWIPTEEKRWRKLTRAERRLYEEFTADLDAALGRALLRHSDLLNDSELVAEAEKSRMRLVLAGIWPKIGHDTSSGLIQRKYKALGLKGLVRGFVHSSNLTSKGRTYFQKKYGGEAYEFLR